MTTTSAADKLARTMRPIRTMRGLMAPMKRQKRARSSSMAARTALRSTSCTAFSFTLRSSTAASSWLCSSPRPVRSPTHRPVRLAVAVTLVGLLLQGFQRLKTGYGSLRCVRGVYKQVSNSLENDLPYKVSSYSFQLFTQFVVTDLFYLLNIEFDSLCYKS